MKIIAIGERILAVIPASEFKYETGKGILEDGFQIAIPLHRLTILNVENEDMPEDFDMERYTVVDGALVLPVQE